MKLWILIAVGGIIVVAYTLLYTIGVTEAQGTASLGLANAAGLIAVLLGLVAAGFILRRKPPPKETPDGSVKLRI